MFLVGYDIFAYSNLGMFQTNNNISIPSSVELTNSIVDEIHIKNDTLSEFKTEKEPWQPSTVALGKFQNDLSYGNMNLNGLTITKLLFKKRKIDSFNWIQFASIPFDPQKNIYEVIDRLVESGETYEYCVIPATSTVEGDMKTKTIDVEFDGTYISDKDSYYKLYYNIEMGDIVQNQPSATIETLGSQYPIVVYNSSINYKSGSIQCLLLSDSTVESFGKIDIRQEKLLRNKIMSFLTNKKPKIFKDSSGNFMIINIINQPRLIPNNSLSGLVYDLSFDFVEVANPYDQKSLNMTGLV